MELFFESGLKAGSQYMLLKNLLFLSRLLLSMSQVYALSHSLIQIHLFMLNKIVLSHYVGAPISSTVLLLNSHLLT